MTNYFFTSDEHYGSERTLKLSKRPFENVNEMDEFMISEFNKKVPENSITFHLGDFGDYKTVQRLNGNHILIWGNYEAKEFMDEYTLLNRDLLTEYTDSIEKLLGCKIDKPENYLKLYNHSAIITAAIKTNKIHTNHLMESNETILERIINFDKSFVKHIDMFNRHIENQYGFNNVLHYGVWNLSKKLQIGNCNQIICTHEPFDLNDEYKINKENIQLFGHIHGRQMIKRYGIDVGVDGHHFRPLSVEDIQFYAEAIEKYYDINVFH